LLLDQGPAVGRAEVGVEILAQLGLKHC
jgi:hypothetical protein